MDGAQPDEVLVALGTALAELQSWDLSVLTARQEMELARQVEVLRRRMDAATDRIAGHLDASGKHGCDGHRTAKAAVMHLGRVSGAEAFGRVRTARALVLLPAVAAAYERGEVPTESMRAIARLASNPRVQPLLDDMVDKVISEQAATEGHSAFTAWLRDLERAADPDGGAPDGERGHERRRAQLWQDPLDGSWEMRATCGALQGAAISEVLAAFEAAEWEADRAAAIAENGPEASPEQFPRTPGQRRMDAILAVFRAAASTPAEAQNPEPIVHVIIDAETLEEELVRIAGDPGLRQPAEDRRRLDELAEGRVCRTLSGRPLHPSDAVAALLVGHVRRVVVDASSNVIDLGRKRRLFTGSSRDAARLQAAIRRRGGQSCFWSGCDGPPGRQQCDHHDPWRSGGRTDVSNSDMGCGFHNRLKEAGFRPVRRPDGGFDLLRPDGTRITPSA